MANHPRLVKVEALAAFTITRPYGQFHGDPNSKRNRICEVPEDAVEDLERRGVIDTGNLSQLDHDGDGEPGGSISGGSGEDIADVRKRYKEVTGKNFFAGWSIDELRAKIDEHLATASTSDESADDDEAPVD